MELAGSVRVYAEHTLPEGLSWHVESLRPSLAQKLVQNRGRNEAARIISQCYVVCKQAQTLAASLTVNEQIPRLQHIRILLEMLDQSLWRWMVDLPRAAGLIADMPGYAVIKRQIFQWIMHSFSEDSLQVGQVDLTELSHRFENLTGIKPVDWQQMGNEQVLAWIADSASPAAAILKYVQQLVGSGEFSELPDLADGYLSQLNGFEIAPAISDKIRQLTSQQIPANPLVCLPARPLVQRLNTMADIVQQLLTELNAPSGGALHSGNQCLSWIMTARGWLMHWHDADPATQQIRHYRILSPTDASFMPAGQVETCLQGLRNSETELRQASELVVLAFDPCVEYRIEI